jgi:hypothetical protein
MLLDKNISYLANLHFNFVSFIQLVDYMSCMARRTKGATSSRSRETTHAGRVQMAWAELSAAESRRNKIIRFLYPLELLVSFLSKEDCILFPSRFVSLVGTHINRVTAPKRSRFVLSLVLRFPSLPTQCVTVTAPLCRRGLGPRPTTSFEYNLRREVPTNLLAPLGSHNLVSRDRFHFHREKFTVR